MQTLNRNFIFVMLLLIGLFSYGCKQKQQETVNQPVTPTQSVTAEQGTITGIWVSENGERWIEFFDNGKLDMEVKGKNRATDIPFTMDSENGKLSIHGKKEVREFTFRLKDGSLFIKPVNADREIKYNKKADRPVY
jgi:hypothetical protein